MGKTGVFHGWWVVGALAMSGFVLFGGGVYGFIALLPEVSDEFHWSHAATGTLVSTFWLAAPVALAGGPMVERLGPERVLLTGVLLAAIGAIGFAFTSTFFAMCILRGIMGLGKILYAVSIPVWIARWFDRQFALGCAIAWAGWHLGGLILAPATATFTALYGWRVAAGGLGAAIIILGLTPALAVMRISRPEDIGLNRDGASGSVAKIVIEDTDDGSASDSWRTLGATPAFWLIILATACFWTAYLATLAHQSTILHDSGLASDITAWALGATAAFAAAGLLAFGWLTDRWTLRRTAIVLHALMVGGLIGLTLFVAKGSIIALILHVVMFGTAIGGGDVFWTTLIKRKLGEAAFSRTFGAWYFVVVVVALVAPIAAGASFDMTHTHLVTVGLVTALAIAAGTIGLALASQLPAPSAISQAF